MYRPSWLSDIHHSLGRPIIPFHNKNGISVLIHPVRNHLAVGTRAVLQTDGAHFISSSRIRYPKKTQKKSVRSPHQNERHPNDQWKSNKLLTLLDGRTRFLSFDFHYENDMRPWMFEMRRVWRIAIFSLDLFIIRHTPRHAEGHHILFFWSYPIYKSFSLWKQHKNIFIMEIILLLLGDKWGDSGQHGCFSLGLFTSLIPSSDKRLPIRHEDGTPTSILYLIYI